jgi:hypothetical protein
MAFDPNDDLQRAIALIQAGRPAEARPLLEAIVSADPERELAWMWLATVSTDRAERIRFLQRVLSINPANETARAAYTRLTGQPPTPPAAPPPATAAGPAPRGARPTAPLIVLAVAVIAVTAVLVALYVRDQVSSDNEPIVPPTLTVQETLTPTLDVSATPSNTPPPTATPGPSPTSVWDSAIPTWTPSPTDTPAPTQRIATWTPRPPTETPTPIPTERPPTDTAEPDVTAAQTPTGEPAGDEDDTVTGED